MALLEIATAATIGRNASEFLAVLAVFGAVIGAFRYQRAARKDMVAA